MLTDRSLTKNSNISPKLHHIRPEIYFLADSLGALLSAFLLGVVLVHFDGFFGMPKKVLYPLALVAVLCCLNTLLCFLLVQQRWRPFLKVISVANILYCFVTIGLVFRFYAELTWAGVTYFALEILVIVLLSALEWRKAGRFNRHNET
ncbi:MAG: hypothetical protein ABR574_06610 [Cryomorphaceae bacterium]|nr:hypothetical protein [Flavobacteriales bacterium]